MSRLIHKTASFVLSATAATAAAAATTLIPIECAAKKDPTI